MWEGCAGFLMGVEVVSHCLVGAEECGHNASVITFWANKTYGVLLQLNQEVCLNRGFCILW